MIIASVCRWHMTETRMPGPGPPRPGGRGCRGSAAGIMIIMIPLRRPSVSRPRLRRPVRSESFRVGSPPGVKSLALLSSDDSEMKRPLPVARILKAATISLRVSDIIMIADRAIAGAARARTASKSHARLIAAPGPPEPLRCHCVIVSLPAGWPASRMRAGTAVRGRDLLHNVFAACRGESLCWPHPAGLQPASQPEDLSRRAASAQVFATAAVAVAARAPAVAVGATAAATNAAWAASAWVGGARRTITGPQPGGSGWTLPSAVWLCVLMST